jgi:hypothetical protein
MAQQGIEELGDDGAMVPEADGLASETAGNADAADDTDAGAPSDNEDDAVAEPRVLGQDEAMRAIATANLETMQRKEWVMKWRGQVFKVREQVVRVVKIAQHISGFVGQAANGSPEVGLALAGVCVLLPVRPYARLDSLP